jgi:hypothetical protein
MKANRHKPVELYIAELNQKLRGHYGYYGITFNSRRLESYYEQVKRLLFKWLNRRGGKRVRWSQMAVLFEHRIPLEKPRIVHSLTGAKP